MGNGQVAGFGDCVNGAAGGASFCLGEVAGAGSQGVSEGWVVEQAADGGGEVCGVLYFDECFGGAELGGYRGEVFHVRADDDWLAGGGGFEDVVATAIGQGSSHEDHVSEGKDAVEFAHGVEEQDAFIARHRPGRTALIRDGGGLRVSRLQRRSARVSWGRGSGRQTPEPVAGMRRLRRLPRRCRCWRRSRRVRPLAGTAAGRGSASYLRLPPTTTRFGGAPSSR